MSLYRKRLFRAIFLFIACLILSYVAVIVFLGNDTLDIALYYTYFVISPSIVFIAGTLLLFFFSTLLHAGHYRFSCRWLNGLFILSVVLLTFCISSFIDVSVIVQNIFSLSMKL